MKEGRRLVMNIYLVEYSHDYLERNGWWRADDLDKWTPKEQILEAIRERVGRRADKGGDWVVLQEALFFRRRVDAVWFNLQKDQLWTDTRDWDQESP